MCQSFTLKSRRVVLPDEVRPAGIVVKNGLIEAIVPYRSAGEGIDCGDKAILPGVVDPHVHFNEPGRTDWEGWETGTKAALAGGVTTVVDMPLNCIPSTVDREAFFLKKESTEGKLYCDVGFWGGAVPGNADQVGDLLKCGVLGFKCFLSDPGTAEFQNLDFAGLKEAMTRIAAHDLVLLVHAEWPSALRSPADNANPRSYSSWLDTRPVEAEKEAIAQVVALAEETGCRCHIVHVSSHQVLPLLEESNVSCETCAHYLVFQAEEIEDGATQFKCAPPIRGREHQEGLWKALGDGSVQMVTSDHSPCPLDLKNDDFLRSWGGIAGVQMLLSATWTGAARRGYDLSQLCQWLCEVPANLAGISPRAGCIEEAREANLVIFDPEAQFRCDSLFHRHGGSPYLGRTWKGVVEATYLRGVRAYSHGEFTSPPQGRFISRPENG